MSNDKTFIINNEGDAVRTGNQFKNMMGTLLQAMSIILIILILD